MTIPAHWQLTNVGRTAATVLLNLCVLCALCGPCFSLDREAFTFTRYDLSVRVDPRKQWLAVDGRISLRNDSTAPQKIVALQISSSLEWKSIQPAAGGPVTWLAQPYVSDIDHTGGLSEAIVTLPRAVVPGGSVELDLAYEGAIVQDGTRLERIGTPKQVAAANDWDQISEQFTALRGLGYVVWYPVALGSVSLSEGNSVFDALARWKERHARTAMRLRFALPNQQLTLAGNWNSGTEPCDSTGSRRTPAGGASAACLAFSLQPLGLTTPAFALAAYKKLEAASNEIYFLEGHEQFAGQYASAADRIGSLIASWFGPQRQKIRIIELAGANAAPYDSGPVLFLPLKPQDPKAVELTVAHQLAHASLESPRAWIYEGAAHWAQALTREQQDGRKAALAYISIGRPALVRLEQDLAPADQAARSLINTHDDILYRAKAMNVWWMLRDVIGDDHLQHVLHAYRPEQDSEASYLQRLMELESKRSLEWFFDDWVYRDRGLPDFRVAGVYSRATLHGGFLVTATVEDLGAAGAEVPVIVRAEGGESSQRVEVHGHDRAVVRIEVPSRPIEAIVNDGSVPESNLDNNTKPIETSSQRP